MQTGAVSGSYECKVAEDRHITTTNLRRKQPWLHFRLVMVEEILSDITVRIVLLVVAPRSKHRRQNLPRLCIRDSFSYIWVFLKIYSYITVQGSRLKLVTGYIYRLFLNCLPAVDLN